LYDKLLLVPTSRHVFRCWKAALKGFSKKYVNLSENYSEKCTATQENASNTVRAYRVSVQHVKKMRQTVSFLCQKNIQLVGKTFALVKYSIQAKNYVVKAPGCV
jgi:hypothetical protein